MDLTTVHKALIGSAIVFFAIIAAKMWMMVAHRSQDFLPMAIFNSAATVLLAGYLVHFVRKTRVESEA